MATSTAISRKTTLLLPLLITVILSSTNFSPVAAWRHQQDADGEILSLEVEEEIDLESKEGQEYINHRFLYHPATGLCVKKEGMVELTLGNCRERPSYWSVTSEGFIALDSTYLIISAEGPGEMATLRLPGQQANGPWTFGSTDGHSSLSTQLDGRTLCLDAISPPSLVTTTCLPMSPTQSFKFVSSF